MSTHKHFEKICVAVTVLALLITIVFMNGESLGLTKVIDQDRENNSDSTYFTSNDQWSDWDTTGATVISLNGDSARVSGAGAYANGSNVVIKQSGFYVVSGTLTDGNVSVDARDSSKVWILLNGADITCISDAALRVDQADKVFLTLAEGTENSLTSGESISEEALADGTDGAIFAHDDLTINGSGSLTVTAGYKHGIAANDDLVITGGDITVKAPQDAIHANDSLRIREAAITVDAGDDGLAVSNEGGYLYIESGTISVKSVEDGIHTTGDITMDGGTLTISAGDDGIHSDAAVTINAGTVLLQECYEGIEAVTIDVNGGDITVYPTDDGFNANGGSSGFGGFGGGMGGGMNGGFGGGKMGGWNNSGSENSSGTENTTESTTPQRPDGTTNNTGTTDNGATLVATAAITTGNEGMPVSPDSTQTAQDTAESEEEETYIRITGGTITILNETAQDADGLDSNGSIYIDGGYILISLSGNGSNNAIDYGSESGGKAVITGGTIIACGGAAMAESFDTSSTQGSIFYAMNTVAAGTNLTVKDSAENTLVNWDVPCSYSAVTVSCPDIKVGGTYQVIVGDTTQEVTLDSTVATIGSSSGGFGGGMGGMGGMRGNWNNGGADTTDGTASQGGFGGGRGGRGGRGGWGQMGQATTDGQTTENGAQAIPSFPSGGELPDFGQFDPSQMGEPPEGFAGERPDFSEMPSPPEMSETPSVQGDGNSDGTVASSEQPAAPAMDAAVNGTTDGAEGSDQSTPPNWENGQRGGQNQQRQTAETEESAGDVTVETVTAKEVSGDTWATLALCGVVLLAGIIFGFAWRKHG